MGNILLSGLPNYRGLGLHVNETLDNVLKIRQLISGCLWPINDFFDLAMAGMIRWGGHKKVVGGMSIGEMGFGVIRLVKDLKALPIETFLVG
jgi:hypothetical protein